MRTWRLEVEYEGTRYGGWQRQPDKRTIQGELQRAAETFLDRKVEIGGSGRTDAGVHALRQVAHLKTNSSAPVPPTAQLLRGINGLLPHDINLLSCGRARPDFHARHDARARSYLYQISTRRTAFGKSFVWWMRDRLDAHAMAEACALLTGRHDFSSFCESPESQSSTLVEVEEARVIARGGLILFRIRASHFLWKMVRRVTGALVEVGRGNLSARGLRALLESYSNEPAAWTAPPSGLFLERVFYTSERPQDEPAPAFFMAEDRP
ncbi:MAG: tRNA pseudouridine(38-40) synthase TruA [Acidobacteria bacterium]|nr:tRNA pseudouridine(38-40) synthase TruA [Acidobacteriota bacterium]